MRKSCLLGRVTGGVTFVRVRLVQQEPKRPYQYQKTIEYWSFTHHREHMLRLIDQTFHQNRFRVIILEELLHLGWEVLRTVTADCVDAHRLRQRDEVGVMHPRVRVPRVVEQIYGPE